MRYLSASLAGLVFGLGLLLSGMANPAKVQGFLDVAGLWDPSLALVMAAAIGVGYWPFRWAQRRSCSLLHEPMRLPQRHDIDARLVGGALLFGIGWGMVGICPGPALVMLLSGHWQVLLFVLAMLAGMKLFSALESRCAH